MAKIRISKRVLMIFICAFFLSMSAYAQNFPGRPEKSFIKYIEVPLNVSEEQVLISDIDVKKQLDLLTGQKTAEWLDSLKLEEGERQKIDLIIIYTKDGKPILPDYGLAVKEGGALLSNEITFTFNSPEYPWTESELLSLQKWVADFYPVVKTVYGTSAFGITVNIIKNPNLGYAGAYNPSFNEIILGTVRDDVFCHEMIHAFRDDNIIAMSSYEEGMTRATEVEVFSQLDAYEHPWDENHSYYMDIYYEDNNQPDIAGKNGNFFWGLNPLLRYQQAGYAWAKAFLEDNEFFVGFNREYYAQIINDPSVRNDESKLKDIAGAIKLTIEGDDFDVWYENQNILNTDPATGYKLVWNHTWFDLTIRYFYRDDTGFETMQAGKTIDWAVYDYNDNLIYSGSGVTTDYGWINIDFSGMSPGYIGRIKIIARVDSPEGEIVQSILSGYNGFTPFGIFGIVKNGTGGEILITPLDNPAPPVSTGVTNGYFITTALTDIRGQFSVVYTDPDNRQVEKIFTKDASHYYVFIDDTFESHLPDITVSPSFKDFGSVKICRVSPAQIFTISNTGDADLVIGGVYLTGTDTDQFSIQNNNCSGRIIAVSGSCTIEAVFNPTKTGTFNAFIGIDSNDPDTPTLYMELTGTGVMWHKNQKKQQCSEGL